MRYVNWASKIIFVYLIVAVCPLTKAQNLQFQDTLIILAGDASKINDARVAVNEQGICFVTWAEHDADTIYGKLFHIDGTSLTQKFPVNSFGTYRHNLTLETDNDGNFILFWQGFQQGLGNQGYGKKYNANGTEVIAQKAITDISNAKLEINKDGNAVLAYYEGVFLPSGEISYELLLSRINDQLNSTGQPITMLSGTVESFSDYDGYRITDIAVNNNVYYISHWNQGSLRDTLILSQYHFSNDTVISEKLDAFKTSYGFLTPTSQAVIFSHDHSDFNHMQHKIFKEHFFEPVTIHYQTINRSNNEFIVKLMSVNDYFAVHYTYGTSIPRQNALSLMGRTMQPIGSYVNTSSFGIPQILDFYLNKDYDGFVIGTGNGELRLGPARINLPPNQLVISDTTVVENKREILVGKVAANDPNSDSLEFFLVSGTGDIDNDKFEIRENNKLVLLEAADYEEDSIYSIRIRADDGMGQYTDRRFLIKVKDDEDDNPNTPPYNLKLSNNNILENIPVGSVIGVFSASDRESPNQLSFEIMGDGNGNFFRILGDQLITDTVFDYESNTTIDIQVGVYDSQDSITVGMFEIIIENDPGDDEVSNTPPYNLTLSNNTIQENNLVGAVVGIFTAADLETPEQVSYSLNQKDAETSDGDYFQISGNQLKTDSVFDYENKQQFTISVTAADPNDSSITTKFTIIILDDFTDNENPNTPPFAISLSNRWIKEHNNLNDTIGVLIANDLETPDQLHFELKQDENFSIVGNYLLAASVFDFEVQSAFPLEIKVRDAHGDSTTIIVVIQILDIPESENELLPINRSGNLNSIRIYPNPVPGNLTVHFPENSVIGICKLKVLSLNGILLWSKELWLDTSGEMIEYNIPSFTFQSGMYLLKIENYTYSTVESFFKQ